MTYLPVKSLVKPSLLMLCAVILSLMAFDVTTAKSRRSSALKATATSQKSSSPGMNTPAGKQAFLRFLRAKAKTNPKFARALRAGCACALPATAGFATCLKDCLISSGVNPYSATACAAMCSRNPLGCAICAGVGEWILAYCVQYCAWYPFFNRD